MFEILLDVPGLAVVRTADGVKWSRSSTMSELTAMVYLDGLGLL